MFSLLSTDDEYAESPATPFEEWCGSMRIDPDDSRAWPLYEATVGVGSHTPAVS